MAEIKILQFQEQSLKINNELDNYLKKMIQIGLHYHNKHISVVKIQKHLIHKGLSLCAFYYS